MSRGRPELDLVQELGYETQLCGVVETLPGTAASPIKESVRRGAQAGRGQCGRLRETGGDVLRSVHFE